MAALNFANSLQRQSTGRDCEELFGCSLKKNYVFYLQTLFFNTKILYFSIFLLFPLFSLFFSFSLIYIVFHSQMAPRYKNAAFYKSAARGDLSPLSSPSPSVRHLLLAL
jgi:hypothetical protein